MGKMFRPEKDYMYLDKGQKRKKDRGIRKPGSRPYQ